MTDSGITPAARQRRDAGLRGRRLRHAVPLAALLSSGLLVGFAATSAAARGPTDSGPDAAKPGAVRAPPALPVPRASQTQTSAPAPAAPPPPCLAAGQDGYLRARLRGTLDLDLAWSGPSMQCEGGARPDGRGLRVTIAGPARDGRRLRFVFGIDDTPEGVTVKARPTNVTVIFEGEQRLFATRGTDKCTTDELRQERIGALGGPRRSWRVVARGFCIGPATTLAGDARLLLTSFDFASEVTHVDESAPPAAAASR